MHITFINQPLIVSDLSVRLEKVDCFLYIQIKTKAFSCHIRWMSMFIYLECRKLILRNERGGVFLIYLFPSFCE